MPSTKAPPSIDVLERKLQEELEACGEFERLCSKLRRLKPGSDAYFDVAADISVAATVLRAKAESIEKIWEEIIEAMPDD